MDEENKLPLKRVELSLSKFNEVAIPHHLDLLRQHKTNIIKYEECGEYARVRAEQTNARRVAAQLRALLAELDALRRRVAPADRPRFDRLTQRSRDLTLRAIVDYLGVIESSCRKLVDASRVRSRVETSPLSINRQNVESKRESEMVCGSAVSTDSVGVVSHAHEPTPPAQDVTALVDDPLIQLQVEDHEAALQSREAVLRGWSELQAEVRALHDTWQHVQAAALAQRDQVASVADNVEVAAENVETARKNLSLAERLRAGAYGAGGAAAGALVGGPLGLVLGAKVAAAGLLAGSALGYLGARLLGRRRRRQLDDDKRD
ncbi:syntaxin-17 isoform X4 [Galleria mellonella]|uniref:Syntaxin-17 isoform X4 n=1 Tax=Galleria mellonella TaxID=7137 RepID=A0A6J3BYG8_GALME|nr:syntaxin-17 isoform X4 [Galleria mellonella]